MFFVPPLEDVLYSYRSDSPSSGGDIHEVNLRGDVDFKVADVFVAQRNVHLADTTMGMVSFLIRRHWVAGA